MLEHKSTVQAAQRAAKTDSPRTNRVDLQIDQLLLLAGSVLVLQSIHIMLRLRNLSAHLPLAPPSPTAVLAAPVAQSAVVVEHFDHSRQRVLGGEAHFEHFSPPSSQHAATDTEKAVPFVTGLESRTRG